MTLQEIKNNIARSFGCKDWKEYIEDMPIKDLEEDMNDVAIMFAKYKCKEQRELCVSGSVTHIVNGNTLKVKPDSILNAPEPKFD